MNRIVVCPPKSHTWNLRFLYITVSTLNPIASFIDYVCTHKKKIKALTALIRSYLELFEPHHSSVIYLKNKEKLEISFKMRVHQNFTEYCRLSRVVQTWLREIAMNLIYKKLISCQAFGSIVLFLTKDQNSYIFASEEFVENFRKNKTHSWFSPNAVVF